MDRAGSSDEAESKFSQDLFLGWSFFVLPEHARAESPNTLSCSKTFLCMYCGKSYRHQCSLTKHVNGMHKMLYRCNICNKACPDKRSLDSHVNNHYNIKPYTCGVCNRKFGNRNSLSRHACITNQVEHTCDHCKESFVQKVELTKHLKTHRSTAHFCKYCGAQFKYASGRYRHEKKRCHLMKN